MFPRSLLRVFALVLGFFYLDTVCQTDVEDVRAYYAHCTTEYVAASLAPVVTVVAARQRRAWQRVLYRALGSRRPPRFVARCPRARLRPVPSRVPRWLLGGALRV